MGFQEKIDFIQDGEPVAAAIPNRPLAQLAANANYLKEWLESTATGAALFLRDSVVDAAVLPGQAVYWNPATQQFEAAKAALVADATGTLRTDQRSHVWGLLYRRTDTLHGDILLHGVAEMDMSAATDTTVAGLYYLSGLEPGHLVAEPPSVPIPVCLLGPAGSGQTRRKVFVNASFREFLDAHRHWKVRLICAPAGTANDPLPGQRHIITSPNENLEGWLPANHSVFAGHAPAGAKFGYNWKKNAALASLWPPMPLEGAYLEWQRGGDLSSLGTGVPVDTVPTFHGLAVIDEYGIWWMTDCYGSVPWPLGPESSLSLSCGPLPEMRMTLWCARPSFMTDQSAVLSLRPKTGSGLSLVSTTTGLPATAGHLEIGLNLDLAGSVQNEAGHLAFKKFQDGKLLAGPLVEGIKAGSSNVVLTSSLGQLPSSGVAQGIVTISVDQGLTGTMLPVQTIRLDGVTEEFFSGVIGLGFPPGLSTEFTGRVHVSAKTALPAGTTMRFRFRLLGRASGTIPMGILSLTYRRIPAPASLNTPVYLPTTDTSLALNCGATLSQANQYYDVESASFEVAAGDVVLFTLSRGAGDGYPGELHVLEESAVLS